MTDIALNYDPIPTIEKFHRSPMPFRCIVGPVGSGKSAGAAVEIFYNIPQYLNRKYGIKRTSFGIIRNTYKQLTAHTLKTIIEWFPWGDVKVGDQKFILSYPQQDIEVTGLFQSCDRPDSMMKLKGLEIMGYWIDESIEVSEDVKKMLKTRIGRFPRWQIWAESLRGTFPERFGGWSNKQLQQYLKENPDEFFTRCGIETTNPPDVEHPTYSMFDWGDTPPPGPLPTGVPLKGYRGFWQPPYENIENLRPGYYDDLRNDYRDDPDWIDMYILGKPGVIMQGQLVYNNFERDIHVAKETIEWNHRPLYRGWDNTGNRPAAVVVQLESYDKVQVLREYVTDRMGIVDFARWVVADCNELYPGAEYHDYGDPHGEAKQSQSGGGLLSNADLMRQDCKVLVSPSEDNFTVRKEAVERCLKDRDGLLIDPSCTRLINGFISGYCYPEIGNTGIYNDKPPKNRFADIHDSLQYVTCRLVHTPNPKMFEMFRRKRKVMLQRTRIAGL